MKRKQAVDLIEYWLKVTDPRIEKRKLAECILAHLEQEGMSPPPDPNTGATGLGQLCQWEYDGENHE
jgi:hypothetical protein